MQSVDLSRSYQYASE